MIRSMTKTDIPWITSNYIREWKASRHAGTLRQDIYYRAYQESLESLLARADVEVLVRVNPEDHDQIFSVLIIEHGFDLPCIHWAQTKKLFRNLGFLKELLTEAKIDPCKPFYYTHRTEVIRDIIKMKSDRGEYFEGIHSPVLARLPGEVTKNDKVERNTNR